MENKSDRRWKLEDQRLRHQDTTSYRSTVARFLRIHKQSLLTSVLLFVLLVLLFSIFSQVPPPTMDNSPSGVTVLNYSTFVQQVKARNIRTVTIQGDDLTGVLAHPLRGGACVAPPTDTTSNPYAPLPSSPLVDPACAVYTRIPASGDAALLPLLHSSGVVITTLPARQSSIWLNLLWKVAPILLFLFLVLSLPPRKGMFSLHTMDDKITQMAKSRARRFEPAPERRNPQPVVFGPGAPVQAPPPAEPRKLPTPSVTFADVAGIDEVRADLEELVQFLRSPERFDRLGAHIPRGILLVGPPGTGKTLLAKAVAGEAGVPFFSMSASEFVEMFVGVGASRVRDLFRQAREHAPCVIFLDEIDAVGRKRSVRITDSGERDQTLNQLLVELDGFDGRSAVIVLAATNRVDMLDRALLRPGRFDRHITVSLPDRVGREAILRVHTRHTPLDDGVRLDQLARQTTGMSGADLANLVNEAALCAARRNLDALTRECFEEALVRIQLGARRPLVMSEIDRRIIAFHESGHALVAYYLPAADKVNRITILPHGQHLGATQFTAEEDRYNYSRETLMARIAVKLGGRVAIELAFGLEGVTTEAEDDLQAATSLAWRMVTHWGMGKQVGVVFADHCEAESVDINNSAAHAALTQPHRLASAAGSSLPLNGEKAAAPQHACAMMTPAARYISSDTMAALIDCEVQSILHDGRARAYALLSEHYDQLTKLARALIDHEQLNRVQFEARLQE
jgi:ATP-dependent metalloprotease FtsH